MANLKKIKLTPKQKKVVAIAAILVIAVAVFVKFIYIPQAKRFGALKSDLARTESEIAGIRKMAGVDSADKSMARSLDLLKKRLKALEARFPDKEEVIFRSLPDLANRFGIDIKSMQPQRKKVVGSLGGVAVSVKGYNIEEQSVAISADGSYRDLGEYLLALGSRFPSPVRITSLQLSAAGSKEKSNRLSIALGLNTYILSSSTGSK